MLEPAKVEGVGFMLSVTKTVSAEKSQDAIVFREFVTRRKAPWLNAAIVKARNVDGCGAIYSNDTRA